MNLQTSISKVPLVGPVYVRKLENLSITSVGDILLHIPFRYKDFRNITDTSMAQIGETVTVQGKVNYIKNIYTTGGKRIQEAEVEDIKGKIKVIWFNQTYLTKTIKTGEKYGFSGRVQKFNRKPALVSPDFEALGNGNSIHTGRLVPVYPETSGVSSKWLRGRVKYLLDTVGEYTEEFLPESVLKEQNLLGLTESLNKIHFPENEKEAEEAKRRLAFDELFLQQLASQIRKNEWKSTTASHKLNVDGKLFGKFEQLLPFKLTGSQKRTINEIFTDLSKETAMNRLLEGDVGSGKTVVAAAGAFAAFVNGYQTVIMAPTQILADQHFVTINKLFEKFKVRVSLVTGAGIKSDLGKTDIFIGTHALIRNKIKFDKVAFVIIDEQHRFGVEQRAHLIKKAGRRKVSPHVLTMTATPIPRTVALTVYGDLDLSTLDELPEGRIPITTWLVPPQKREGAYEWIKEQIEKDDIQAFVICPLIEESRVETMKQVKAATEEYKHLQKVFNNLKLGLLHGRQGVKEKNEVLDRFRTGKIDVLVSTPVVEVGIDVPNATIMVIEAGERYGLAQLHQLRGRIGRGDKKSYCLVFTESRSPRVITRLNSLRKSLSGFELAELDLKMRGPGEIFGIKQHGFPELKIASWQDTGLIKAAKRVSEEAVSNPKKFAEVIDKVKSLNIIPN